MLYKLTVTLGLLGVVLCLIGFAATVLLGHSPVVLAIATGVVMASLFICILLAVWLE